MEPLHLASPHIIALVGLPGAGKTHFGTSFADTFSAPFIDERSIATALRQPTESAAVVTPLLTQVMKTKQTIIFEGSLDQRRERDTLARFAKEQGYRVLFVWVQADKKVSQSRALKSLSSEAYEQRAKRFSPPHGSEPYIVISGHHTLGTQMRTLLKHLSDQQAKTPGRQMIQRPTRRIRVG